MFLSQFKNNNATSLFYIQIDKQHCLAIIMMHPEHHHANRNEISYIGITWCLMEVAGDVTKLNNVF